VASLHKYRRAGSAPARSARMPDFRVDEGEDYWVQNATDASGAISAQVG